MKSRTLLLILAASGVLAYVFLLRRPRSSAAPSITALPNAELPGVLLPLLSPVQVAPINSIATAPLVLRSSVNNTTRGIRNHNPGNIKISGSAWQGKRIPNTDGTFEQFTDPAYGIRALAKTLLTYQQKHGLNTVRGLITRWSATDQAPYIANVAKAIGMNPDNGLDLYARPDLLRGIVVAIIRQENGQQPYPLALIDQAIAAARG